MPFTYSDPEFSRAVIARRAEPGRESPRGSVALWTASSTLSAPGGLSVQAWESALPGSYQVGPLMPSLTPWAALAWLLSWGQNWV